MKTLKVTIEADDQLSAKMKQLVDLMEEVLAEQDRPLGSALAAAALVAAGSARRFTRRGLLGLTFFR